MDIKKEFNKAVKQIKKRARKSDKNGIILLTIEEAAALHCYFVSKIKFDEDHLKHGFIM